MLYCVVSKFAELVRLAHSAPMQVCYLFYLEFAATTRDREKVAPTQQHPPCQITTMGHQVTGSAENST